ncbi:MAG: rhodanese-like domain-containing protein [Oscillospiraceae bacterium]
MSSFAKKFSLLLTVAVAISTFTGCSGHTFEKGESKLVEVKQLAEYTQKENVTVVDMRAQEEYAKGHLQGAVNIPVSEIVINVPVKNMLTSKKKIEKLLSNAGISNDTTVVAYDGDKMSAARFLWTLFMYGHENVMVVNGGIEAIKASGAELSTETPTITPAVFTAKEPSSEWLVKQDRVLEQVNNPDPNVILLDVRSDEEYIQDGKIPSSIMMDYNTNYYGDNTLKDIQTTQINYLQAKIFPENEIIIYCKTSFRAAPVFLQLYEAGYRNIKLYDGAYLEWSQNSSNPIDRPAGAQAPTKQDAS